MHRIASLGDMQESNKHERHHSVHSGARKHSTLWDSDDEQHAAMVDLGKVFEFVLKNTVVALVAAAWTAIMMTTGWLGGCLYALNCLRRFNGDWEWFFMGARARG